MNTRFKLLEKISEQEQVPQNWLAHELDVSKQRVSTLLQEIEENELIVREKEGRQKLVSLTERGADQLIALYREREDPGSRTGSSVDPDLLPGRSKGPEALDFHKTMIRVEIDNLDELKEEFGDKWGDFWAKSWLEKKGYRYKENKANHGLIWYRAGYEVWFTESYVFIRLEDIRSKPEDVFGSCERVMAEGARAIDWLEGAVPPLQVDRESAEPCFSVSEQHIALVEEGLAQLVVEHPDTNLNNFKVFVDGELRMWVDNSDGEAHLEVRRSGHGPEDLHFIFNEVYRSFIDEKEGWRGVIDLVEEHERGAIGSLPEQVEDVGQGFDRLEMRFEALDSTVDGVAGQVQRNRDEFYERMDEQDERIGDAVERVDSVQQVFSERIQGVREEVASNAQVNQAQAETMASLRDQLGQVDQELRRENRMLLEEIRESRQHQELQRQEDRELLKEMLKEQRRIRELQERTIWDKARRSARSAVSKVKTVVQGFLD